MVGRLIFGLDLEVVWMEGSCFAVWDQGQIPLSARITFLQSHLLLLWTPSPRQVDFNQPFPFPSSAQSCYCLYICPKKLPNPWATLELTELVGNPYFTFNHIHAVRCFQNYTLGHLVEEIIFIFLWVSCFWVAMKVLFTRRIKRYQIYTGLLKMILRLFICLFWVSFINSHTIKLFICP